MSPAFDWDTNGYPYFVTDKEALFGPDNNKLKHF